MWNNIVAYPLALSFLPPVAQINNSRTIPDEFESGIEAYKTYLLSLAGQESSFSPTELLSIIDTFSGPLVTHLRDEIPTLLSLSRFGPSIPFLSLSETEMQKA